MPQPAYRCLIRSFEKLKQVVGEGKSVLRRLAGEGAYESVRKVIGEHVWLVGVVHVSDVVPQLGSTLEFAQQPATHDGFVQTLWVVADA